MKRFSSQSQKIGLLGEDIACRYLEKKGLRIVERNYTKKWGEIDIIAAEKSGKLRFVEVKSVSRENLDSLPTSESGPRLPQETSGFHRESIRPEENMHPKKMERMARTVETYLAEKDVRGEWQVDLVTVWLNEATKQARVEWWEDIVLS
jgi:Holliday junction resolvase-like predicted endonuclease